MSAADDPFQITAEDRLHFQVASEFFNALNDIAWMARPDGHIDYYNRHWFKYTGMTLEQTKAAGWSSLIHPNDVQHCMDGWANALKTGEPDKFEFRLLRIDGTYRWHSVQAIPVRNSHGKITRWLGICQDIEDHVHTQRAIQESYEKHKQKLLARMLELEDTNARMVEELTMTNQSLQNELDKQEKLIAELQTAKQNEKIARYAAFHDPLTTLPNRALFNDRLEHGIALARRHDRILAVMFIDLDKFKQINDTFGHLVGDKVLIEAAERLMKVTRKDDTVCRQGGDEFLYLLFEIRSEADVTVIAEKINRAVSGPCRIEAENKIVNPVIVPSIGVAIFPKDGDTADELIKKADSAMYRAKRDQTGYALAE
jgi:diguanylate cyclase (GGDEF)-like protein/PAS domain S-box-containing protein